LWVLSAAIGFAAMSAGCYRNSIVNEAVIPNPESESETETKVFFAWGLAGSGEVDVRDHCHSAPVASVSYYADPVDVVVSGITLGLVGLRSVEIQCGTPAPRAVAKRGAR